MRKFFLPSILLVPLIPLFILMISIRILLTPAFVQFEYNQPGFPVDKYGFNTADRLHWANSSIDYLLNNSDISFLGYQKLADGKPLFNDRELQHMLDVKNLVQWMLRTWYFLIIFLLALLGIFILTHRIWNFIRILEWGGWLTCGIVIAIVIYLFLNFDQLFTNFHRIFFSGDTWIFLYSDSLIRLFPIQFWQDAFLLVGIITFVIGILFIFISKIINKKLA